MKPDKLALALASLLLAPVASAFAQNTTPSPQTTGNPPPEQPAKQLETITVTGSAIPRVDVETPSPVTMITAQQIERSGLTTVSDVVRAISADNSGSIPNAFANGFAAGAAGVALRGLTVNSTLVLIDGHRNANYAVSDDGQRSFVDLNTIPLAAVDHIEVLKDGASSLYGADAIAGVVNIILKRDYRGAEGTVDVGTSQHGGGFTRKATLVAGGGDLDSDRYNAYFSAQYQKDNAINISDRDFPFNTADLSSIGGDNNEGGQPSQNSGSIYGSVRPGTLGTPGNITTGEPLPGGLYQPLRPCGPETTPTTDETGTFCQQNFVSQFGQVQPAMEQGGLYGRFTVKLNDMTRAYMSASYFQAKTQAPAGPRQIQTGTPNNTRTIALPPLLADGTLNPNNPFAAAGQYALINYAFGDIPSGFNYDNHNVRVVGGLSGAFGEWNYDAALVINHTWLDTTQYGFIDYNGLINAITTGSYSFIDPASNTTAQRAALAPGYSKTSTSDLDSLDFSVNRALWDLPGGSLGLAAGVQFRHEAQDDPTLNPNFQFQGLGNAQTKGSRDIGGAYLEFSAPMLESLEVDVSGRFDHYTDIGNGFTPKVGFKWKPVDWFAFRGTYSKGLRAPNFAENGSSSSQGFITYSPITAVPDFAATHNNNGYVQPYALSLFTVANPNIEPEKATNYTLGLVVEPTSWLSASIDYYNIKKSKVIAASDTGSALDNYFAGLPQPIGVTVVPDSPDAQFPTALPRPIEVIGTYINANSLKTDGIDLDLRANFDFGRTQYISELSGTEIFNYALILPDGSRQSYVGTHGPYNLSSGAGTPRYRAAWANTLVFGPATVTGTLYYTSGFDNTAEDVAPPGVCISTLPLNCHVGSYTQLDLTGRYAINDHFAITASVMNALDRKPPLDQADYAGAGANYNPTWAQGGLIGRFYNLGVQLKL